MWFEMHDRDFIKRVSQFRARVELVRRRRLVSLCVLPVISLPHHTLRPEPAADDAHVS